MNFKLATLILGALAAVGSSSPVVAPEDKNSAAPGTFHKLVSGGPAGKAASPQADKPLTHLYVCTDANFKGRCENLASTKQGCYTLFNGLDNVVSSLGPDAGTTCIIYEYV
ncbi:MAG: hypothetical protein Q9167_002752 [Letrouitia subvulpina]